MTITYTAQVATCRHLGCFWKLLFRWRGSIYKLLWVNMLLYILLFISFKLVYLFMLDSDQKKVMAKLGNYCHAFEAAIPLSFLLGFYVAIVITRWWEQYLAIPWPDGLAVLVSVFLTGQDVRGRVMRRTIMRYANLCMVMTFTMISPFVKRRFPNYQSYVDAGLLLPSEHQRLKDLEKRTTHPKHWVPLTWAIAIVARARREGKIADDVSKETIIMEINSFRGTCGMLLNYDWISIPLVYPQVVSWAVYTYFATTLISYQFPVVDSHIENEKVLMFLPVFPMLQFFFYMGWLLVAETLANPFGEDDDDFDISWLIDRNIQVSYCIADEMHHTHPELLKDQYWDDVLPPDSPWNPHTDIDDPEDQDDYDDPKDAASKSEAPSGKTGGRWLNGADIVPNIAKYDFVSRSLDVGSERVIRVYLPPSLSRITFGSGLSKGSRPSGDSKPDHSTLKDVVTDVKVSDARTQFIHHPNEGDKEEEVPRFAAAASDYSESRAEEENEDGEIIGGDNFIYNQNRGPNQVMINPSSRNVLQIGNTVKRDFAGTNLSNDSSSSLGLHLLLSENVIQKINEMNQTSDETSSESLTNENIVIKETSKISKDEKILHGSKSKSGHKSILKTQDEISSIEEKSVRSIVRTISMPVTFGKEIVDEIEELVEDTFQLENRDNQGRTIEFVDTYNEKYEENIIDELQSSYSIQSPDRPENYQRGPRIEAESLHRSMSEPGPISYETIADSQYISDMLFDHILNEELSKTSKYEESKDDQNISQFSLYIADPSDKQDQSRQRMEDFITFDSDIEPSLSDNLCRDDQIDFKSVIDDFDTQELQQSFILNDKSKEKFTEVDYNDDGCIYELIDDVSYNVVSENNSICIFDENSIYNEPVEEIVESNETETNQNASETYNLQACEAANNLDVKQNEISHPSSSGASLKMDDYTRSPELDPSPKPSAQSVNESIDEMEEFRNKVAQSVSFKHCSLSPSQPKIIPTLLQQSSPLSTVIELPEEDSDVELS